MADRMKGEDLARERFTGSIQPRCISQRDLGWHGTTHQLRAKKRPHRAYLVASCNLPTRNWQMTGSGSPGGNGGYRWSSAMPEARCGSWWRAEGPKLGSSREADAPRRRDLHKVDARCSGEKKTPEERGHGGGRKYSSEKAERAPSLVLLLLPIRAPVSEPRPFSRSSSEHRRLTDCSHTQHGPPYRVSAFIQCLARALQGTKPPLLGIFQGAGFLPLQNEFCPTFPGSSIRGSRLLSSRAPGRHEVTRWRPGMGRYRCSKETTGAKG